MISKCKSCNNFLTKLERCKFCHFDLKERRSNDKFFNLLSLDDGEKLKFQIISHLYNKGIECLYVDVCSENNLVLLIGIDESKSKIAKTLGIHKDVIYQDSKHNLVMLNLFQEKFLRGLL